MFKLSLSEMEIDRGAAVVTAAPQISLSYSVHIQTRTEQASLS